MSNTEITAQQCCAWCSKRVGEMNIRLTRNGAAHFEGWYFCTEECLQQWLESE